VKNEDKLEFSKVLEAVKVIFLMSNDYNTMTSYYDRVLALYPEVISEMFFSNHNPLKEKCFLLVILLEDSFLLRG